MSTNPEHGDRLDSWKEIAAYIGRDVRTVIRWEQRGGLPVYRIPVGQRQAVYAYRHEIDAWLNGSPAAGPKPGTALEVTAAFEPEQKVETCATPRREVVRPQSDHYRSGARRAVLIGGLAVVMLATGFAVHSVARTRRIEATNVIQITEDGTDKRGLVTDGENLYFSEYRAGRRLLSYVGIDGGAVRTIRTPFVDVQPEAISDGRRLLALVTGGQQDERELWIVPVTGGPPRRVGDVHCHSAAWAPDGRQIAFADGDAIYLTDDQGSSVRQIQAFTLTPQLLRWSHDGKRLRFELSDPPRRQSWLWELSLANPDSALVSSLTPLHLGFSGCCDSSTAVDQEDRSFLTGGEVEGRWISVVSRSSPFWGSHLEVTRLDPMLKDIVALTIDSRSRRLFAIGSSPASAESGRAWSDLFVVDRRSGEFRPFLPGVPAADVNYSRDGRWMVWKRTDTETLWIGRADGTDARQIQLPKSGVQLPGWSPDGRQIAFMAKLPNQTWRIFVVSTAKGAEPRELEKGLDSQGAPTWSPDGKYIVYGNVWCEESRTCAIHKVELSTGQDTTIPGSEGLETARWSPNGHLIAALRPDRQSIEVFDVKTGKWRTLADEINGNDLSWSADSRYVYASNPNGSHPNVVEIAVATGAKRPAADFSAFSFEGRIDTWFGLTPDGSIIFMRWHQPSEIYSLRFQDN